MTLCNCGARHDGFRDDQAFAHSDWCKTKEVREPLTMDDMREAFNIIHAVNHVHAPPLGTARMVLRKIPAPANGVASGPAVQVLQNGSVFPLGHPPGVPVLSPGVHTVGRWTVDVIQKGAISILTKYSTFHVLFDLRQSSIMVNVFSGGVAGPSSILNPRAIDPVSFKQSIVSHINHLQGSPISAVEEADLNTVIINAWRWCGWP